MIPMESEKRRPSAANFSRIVLARRAYSRRSLLALRVGSNFVFFLDIPSAPEHPIVGDNRTYYVTDQIESVHLHLTQFIVG